MVLLLVLLVNIILCYIVVLILWLGSYGWSSERSWCDVIFCWIKMWYLKLERWVALCEKQMMKLHYLHCDGYWTIPHSNKTIARSDKQIKEV